jgi:epoxyqueuosine reductase
MVCLSAVFVNTLFFELKKMNQNNLKQFIQETAFSEGFVDVGYLNITEANFPGWIDHWLENHYHADMNWLENYRSIRENPCTIVENGKSIISLLFPYKTEPPKQWNNKHLISNYAWGKDYHGQIKKKLKKIYLKIQQHFPAFEGHYFVDTAPIPEKVVAAKCGLGWIGKNSLLINKKYGSYVFIAEMVCNQALLSTPPTESRCGKCNKCIEACPSRAIIDLKTIDANKCISYLTIEKKAEFNLEEQKVIQYQLFGCDICQQVCPWNKKAPNIEASEYRCFERWKDFSLKKMLTVTDIEFSELKINSPIKRAGLKHLKRTAKAILNQQSGLID